MAMISAKASSCRFACNFMGLETVDAAHSRVMFASPTRLILHELHEMTQIAYSISDDTARDIFNSYCAPADCNIPGQKLTNDGYAFLCSGTRCGTGLH